MKKTFTINLGGTVYHIDEDAYELLDNYLSNLRIHFSKEEGAEEIVHDMELRISELFSERLHDGKQVITIKDVEEIIARMGKPEDLSDECEKDTIAPSSEGKAPKRLFRDGENKVIGGVCSGIAAYMDWDITIVRLLFLIFGFFMNGAFIIAYLVMWFVVPMATTATEKLSMKGIKANVRNIGETVTEGFEKVNDYVQSEQSKSTLQMIGEGIVNVAGFLIKCLFIIVAICLSPVLFILLIVCFSLLMAATGIVAVTPALLYEAMPHVDWTFLSASPTAAIILSICGILVIGLPIIGIIHSLMSTFGNWKPISVGSRIAFICIWIFAVCAGLYLVFMLNLPVCWEHIRWCC